MKSYYANEQIKEVLDEKSSELNSVIADLTNLIENHVDNSTIQTKITELSQTLYNTSKELASLGESLIKDSEGTQTTDVSTKEDYPKFKLGKQISHPFNEDESSKQMLDRLQSEEQDAISSYRKAKETDGLPKDIVDLLDHIEKEEIEHYLELRSATKTI